MAAAGNKKRAYHPVEKRLVSEFIHERWPGAPMWERPRLGPYTPPRFGTVEERQREIFEKVKRRYADAVVFDGEALWIVEGKVIASGTSIGQLDHYRELIRITPEYMAFEDADVRLLLVAVHIPDDIKRFAERKGIVVVKYAPDWAVRHMEKRAWR